MSISSVEKMHETRGFNYKPLLKNAKYLALQRNMKWKRNKKILLKGVAKEFNMDQIYSIGERLLNETLQIVWFKNVVIKVVEIV